MHGHTFDKFIPPVEQTARFCGMLWQPPLILHGSHHATDGQLHERGLEYRSRISAYLAASNPPPARALVGADA